MLRERTKLKAYSERVETAQVAVYRYYDTSLIDINISSTRL